MTTSERSTRHERRKERESHSRPEDEGHRIFSVSRARGLRAGEEPGDVAAEPLYISTVQDGKVCRVEDGLSLNRLREFFFNEATFTSCTFTLALLCI